MGSSATPFLPSGGGGQIGAFPTFSGPPLFADDDGLVAVAAFPPLAAFGFGTFCPAEDQPQQQQLFVPGEQQHVPGEQQHQFLPIQNPFLGDAAVSRFTAEEPQLMLSMACGGSFLTDPCEVQQQQNYFTTTLPENNETFMPISQNQSIFGTTNCAIAVIERPKSSPVQSVPEMAPKSEKSDDQCKGLSAEPLIPPLSSTVVRRGHPTQRGAMRRRTAERMGKRKIGQNANAKLLAAITQSAESLLICEEDAKEEVKKLEQQMQNQKQLLTSLDDPLKLNSVQPIATVASEYSMPSTVALPDELKWCAHCKQEIRDRVMLAFGIEMSQFYHCECLKCCDCAAPLENAPRCYVRDERIYCIECFAKTFVKVNCPSCEKRIEPFCWVRRAGEFFYHMTCFKCEHCKRQLGTGDQCSLDDLYRPPPAIPRLLCKMHYTELVLGEQSSSKQKTKRVRTTFDEDQLNILQHHFKNDSNPDGADLERIAYLTGLSKRVTQVWFQNSRARQKKYHGHASCRKSGAGGVAAGSSSASVCSGAGMDISCLGECRSATLTPSSSSNGVYTAGQSPALFGRGGSTGSESDGLRQLPTGATSPSAVSGRELYSADGPNGGEATQPQSEKKDEEILPK